jgi:glycosyltransferase involved in cell wall biosynthesis
VIFNKVTPIVLFVNTLSGGGTEKVVLQLANYYTAQGHSVHLILMNNSGHYLKHLDENVVVHELNMFLNRYFLIKKIMRRLQLLIHFQILSLRRIIKKNKFKTLVCFGEWPNLIGPLAKTKSEPIKVFISERSSRTFITNPGEYNVSSLIAKLAQKAFDKADDVVACSWNVKQALLNLKPDKAALLKLISNPIDQNKITKLAKEQVKHPFFTEPDSRTLIAIGRLHKSKDYPTMLRAIAIARKCNNLKLIILGDGVLKENC